MEQKPPRVPIRSGEPSASVAKMRRVHMKGALIFGLVAAVVAGVAMAVTLYGHHLGNDWWLALAAGGAAGLVGFGLGVVAHLLTRRVE
jgi:uncharacterized membrane protein